MCFIISAHQKEMKHAVSLLGRFMISILHQGSGFFFFLICDSTVELKVE